MATGFSRIVSQLGYTKQFLSPNLGRVTVPGLPYTAFDAYEYPQSWSVLNTMDSAQTCLLHKLPQDDAGSLLDINNLFDHYISYSVAVKIYFNKQLYNKSIVKSPLYIDSKMSHVGKTSLVIDSEMKTESALLASFRHQQLCVDETNKRPLPIPDWLKRNYEQFGDHGEPIKFPVLQKPSQQSSVTRVAIGQVKYSDTDANFHLNFSNYLKYCIDGVFKGMVSQLKPGTHPKPLLVKSAFTWYRNECVLGDSLDIEYWKDETNATCVDMLRDNTSVCQCILEFYDAENLKSSL